MDLAGTPERGIAASWQYLGSSEATWNTLQNREFGPGPSSPQPFDECLSFQGATTPSVYVEPVEGRSRETRNRPALSAVKGPT